MGENASGDHRAVQVHLRKPRHTHKSVWEARCLSLDKPGHVLDARTICQTGEAQQLSMRRDDEQPAVGEVHIGLVDHRGWYRQVGSGRLSHNGSEHLV